jgi:hypothetical protein
MNRQKAFGCSQTDPGEPLVEILESTLATIATCQSASVRSRVI